MGTILPKREKCKTNQIVTLRNATQDDALKLNELAVEVFKTSEFLITTPDEFTGYSVDQQRERIKTYEEDDGNILLVVEFENELVGMLDFRSGKRKRIAHKGTFGMSVRSSWRSKGIGQILLSALIEWVERHPLLEVINLGVIENNKPAVGLYRKLGFDITGREPYGVKLDDGSLIADLSMSLRVQKSQ